MTRLNTFEMIHALERINREDLPKLTVTKLICVPGQPPKSRIRDFSQLLLGQQQSVLLALMLSSDRNQPLLLDPPDDNLDSAFIYATLVFAMRRAKERRQIVVITHTPTLPCFQTLSRSSP